MTTSRRRRSVRRNSRRKTTPLGECYEWAYRQIFDDDSGRTVLVHGVVTEPFKSPPHKYVHAWIERDGKVLDWQTIEGGGGGHYHGVGFPVDLFYELFRPTKMRRYDQKAAMLAAVKNKHFGPWHGRGSR